MLSILNSFVGSFSLSLGLIYLGICTESCWRASELLSDNLKANLGLGSLTRWAEGFTLIRKESGCSARRWVLWGQRALSVPRGKLPGADERHSAGEHPRLWGHPPPCSQGAREPGSQEEKYRRMLLCIN